MTDTIWQDVRYATRSLRRTPGFTAATVITLALAIGATTGIFSLVNAVLLKPVPYPDPDRLVVLNSRAGSSWSGQVFVFLRERLQTLDALAAQSLATAWNLSTRESAVSVTGLRVSEHYLRVHGVRPLLGREFTASEDQPGGPNAAMISEDIWRRVFGGRPDALGQTIQLGAETYAVVGVLPPGFESFPPADVMTPLRTTARDTGRNYRVLGRLRPDASPVAAQTEIDTVRADFIRDRGLDANAVPGFEWAGYRDVLGRGARQPLLILLGAVAFLLLIACVNVASLYISRAMGREREMATRAALGAPRSRLLRQVLTESLLVAAIGGFFGLSVAAGGIQLLLSLVSQDTALGLLGGGIASLDWRVLIATTIVTLIAGLFFGIVPAVTLSKVNAGATFNTRTTAGRRTTNVRRSLAIAEVALAAVLLVGAGLLMRTFTNLTRVDLGFSPSGIVIGRMSMQGTAGEDATRRSALLEQALARIRQIPGVSAAAVSNNVPVESGLNLALQPPAGSLIDRLTSVDWRYITPEYFQLFGIPTRAGRTFDDGDRPGGRSVAIVNEAFARAFFGRTDVTGQTLQLAPDLQDPPREIVGVVANVTARSNSGFARRGPNALAEAVAPAIYVPAAQAPDSAIRIANRFFEMRWIVRTSGATSDLEGQMQSAVRASDPTLPFSRFMTMTSVIQREMDIQRLLTILLGAFASSAILLAAVGLYGLIAYSAAQRRRELGIRMALGATSSWVLKTFVGEGLMLAAIGLSLGAIGAAGMTRLMAGLLYGVTPLDAVTFVGAGAVLLGVAASAALIPAAGAARTDPVQALRGD